MGSTVKGWILLHKQIQSHWLWEDKPFSRGQAWIDLLLLAEHETHKSMWRSQLTEFKRGDVNLSITELAKRWGWSRDKARRFISQLESDNMVIANCTTNRTTLTIVNYDDFQNQRTTNKATNKATDNTTDKATDKAHLKNNKRIIKEDKEIVAPLPDDEIDPDWDDSEWVDAKDLKLEGEY